MYVEGVKTRDIHSLAKKIRNIQPIFNPTEVLESREPGDFQPYHLKSHVCQSLSKVFKDAENVMLCILFRREFFSAAVLRVRLQ